ncbi:hypothetical protein MATL_G00011740 [Megalops atlanticus]|uniref:Tectonic-3 n=1 Tax=Megalops atlanticus TaxID=7932 RepID=A0A9D3TEK1_MEGAT|nr:hypothetical protein MATL_G00011740 [Megalops atlanticus]
MATSLLSHALQFAIILSICSNGRVLTQPTVPDTLTANPTELPSVTTGGSTEELVISTAIPTEKNSQAVTEFDSTSPGSFETVTPEATTHSLKTTIYATTDTDRILTDATTETNVIPTDASTETAFIPAIANIPGCTCDVTPGLCDIGCCCDTSDCDMNDLGSVFSGCEGDQRSGVCIESWLMFRGNVDPDLITVNDSYFCVRSEVQLKDPQALPALSSLPKVQDSYSFSQQDNLLSSTTASAFYRVDDAILTYFNSSSLLGVLRQPSPGAATSSCVDRNPARFLRSVSLFCSRSVTPHSCVGGDRGLNARSYFSGIRLLKAPVPQNVSTPSFTIPLTPLSEWPEPSLENNSCLNVVSKVEYVIQYTSEGAITNVMVNLNLRSTNSFTQLLQEHAVRYTLATPSPTPGPSPVVGLLSGAPVIGRFGNIVQPLTVQGMPQGGECFSAVKTRTPVLFTHNYVTGCTFSSPSHNCSELRSQLFEILEGPASPDDIAMNSGTQPDWTRVITQRCGDTVMEDCKSGCLVPHSLSVQLLWAQRGLLSLPQNQILGAKFLFQCQIVKCPVTSPLVVTTEVTFSDATAYPEPPRGQPQPQWKFPFGFFSRGKEEQDAGPATNCYGHSGAVWGTLWIIAFVLMI